MNPTQPPQVNAAPAARGLTGTQLVHYGPAWDAALEQTRGTVAEPVAVLVCHGMGQQVRYETISQVADAIRVQNFNGPMQRTSPTPFTFTKRIGRRSPKRASHIGTLLNFFSTQPQAASGIVARSVQKRLSDGCLAAASRCASLAAHFRRCSL